jgi:integrase
MRKTGAGKNVQLLSQAEQILSSYADRRGSQEFVFPFLDRYIRDPEWDLSRTEDLDNAINNRNSVVNNRLGDIAEELGISKSLTTHVARHSAANRMAADGWTLQEIQSALGHSDVTVTQEYIRTLRDDELDDKHREMF